MNIKPISINKRIIEITPQIKQIYTKNRMVQIAEYTDKTVKTYIDLITSKIIKIIVDWRNNAR